MKEYKNKYDSLKKYNDDYDNEIKILKEDNILIKEYIEEIKSKFENNKEYEIIKEDNKKIKEAIKIILTKIK